MHARFLPFLCLLAVSCSTPGTGHRAANPSTTHPLVAEASRALADGKYDKASGLIAQAVDQAVPRAALLDALRHEFGIGVAIDSERAAALAREAAAAEDWEAAQFLAWLTLERTDEEPNLLEAETWRGRIEEWRSAHPHPRILPENLLYPEKKGYLATHVPVNDWLSGKALEGDPIAQYNLFVILLEGRGSYPNAYQALNWLMLAANSKNIAAATRLADYYRYGILIQENPTLAHQYQLIGAQAGHAESQYRVARDFLKGRGTLKSVDKAVQWLGKAAGQNHLEAVKDLAKLYYDGDEVPEDYAKAFTLYHQAAGIGDLYADYKLGWMVFYGQGTDSDPAAGMALLEKAAEAGSKYAPYALSQIYLEGRRDIPKDYGKAEQWARLAIERDNLLAHRTLAKLYQEGLGRKKDRAMAFYHLEQLAREGYTHEQFLVASMLLIGSGIDQDWEEAYTWFSLAAAQGERKAAEYKLLLEATGKGTPLNEESRRALTVGPGDPDAKIPPEQRDLIPGILSLDKGPARKTDRLYAKSSRTPGSKELEAALAGLEGRNPEADSSGTPGSRELQTTLQGLEPSNRAISSAAPRPVYRPAPYYPRSMRLLGINETVLAVFIVKADGTVANVSFEGEALLPFAVSIEETLRKWRFEPGMQDGKPVNMRVRQSFPFRVEEAPSIRTE